VTLSTDETAAFPPPLCLRNTSYSAEPNGTMEQNQSGSGQQQQRQPPPVYDPNSGGHYGMLPSLFASMSESKDCHQGPPKRCLETQMVCYYETG